MGQDPSYSKSYSDQELTTSKSSGRDRCALLKTRKRKDRLEPNSTFRSRHLTSVNPNASTSTNSSKTKLNSPTSTSSSRTKLNSPPNPHCSPRKFSGGKSVPRKSVGGGERRSALIGVSYDRWDARTPLAGYARRYVPDSGPDNRRDERDGSSPPLTSEAKPLKSLTWRSPKRIKQYADWRSFLPPPAPARPKQPAPPSPELKVSAKAPAGPFTQLTDQQIFKLQGQEKRVYEILEHQLDIEIFQKQRELAEIHHELSIGYRLLDKFTKQAKSQNRERPQNPSPKAAEEQLTKPEAAGLFARWEDGLFVRIVCPECGKGNFEDEGLFLDHLRKLHSIAYPSIQEAYAGCGLSIPAYQVPPDHPCRSGAPLTRPPDAGFEYGCVSVMFKQFQEARAQLYQERPKIKVYDEEIDLGTWVDAQPTPEPAPVPLAMLREAKEGVISDEPEHEMTEDERQSPAADIPNKTLATHQGFPQGLPLIHADLPCPPPLPGQDCSVVARLMLEETSRFHVRKTIVFGNISKPVTTDGEGGEPTFFRWLVYVSGPPYAPDLSSFVARVKFILHPSYAPHDVVELTAPPFQASRLGWGEFPVRAQLTFHDARNKSVELIHNLTLCLDFEPHEAEDRFEIELDRDTGFVPAVAQPPTPSASEDNVPASPAPNLDTHALLTRLLEAFPIVAREPQPRLAYRPVGAPSQLASLRPAQRQSLEWHRANAMLAALRRELGPQRSSPLSSKQVLLWCRAHDPLLAELEAGGYCVVCGQLASQLRPAANRCASCQGVRPKLTTLSLPNALLGALPSGWDSLFDPEASNEDLVIDDEPGARTRLPPAALSFTRAAHPPPIPPAELNFTRAAMAPLRLPCAPADRTSHVAMAMATRLFLNALLARIIHSQFPGRQTVSAAASVALNPDDARPPRKVAQLITPMHVWSSLRGARGNLDFLTNAYTGAQ